MVLFLRVILVICIISVGIMLLKDVKVNGKKDTLGHYIAYGIMGFVLNLLDTLGVGSNATQMIFFKMSKLSPDEDLPGNGNVIFAIPVAVEALLFLGIVEVDTLTLVSMLAAAMVGSYVGAKIMTSINVNALRAVLVVVLPIVSVILVAKINGFGPFGLLGTATALRGTKLVIAIVVNFILGGLMTAGVGLYAPCMALIALLGMNVTAAFPIMMCSCALLMPISSIEFIKKGRYNREASIVATITGVLGVFVAYLLVKSMPIKVLTYIVACVLIYMSISFIISIRNSKKTAGEKEKEVA